MTPTNTKTPTNTPTPSTAQPITNTYITFTSDTVSRATYTFSGVSIGGPGLIAVSVHAEAPSGVRSITTATINGVAATIASQLVQGTTQPTTTGIIYLRVTAGTTADISITFTAAPSRCGIGVWRIQNNISDTPLQSQTAGLNSGTGLTITFTSLTTNNVGVCAETNGTDTTSMTWTNATEQYDVSLGAGTTRMSGADFITVSSGNRTVSTSFVNSAQPITLVGVVWN